MICSLFLSSNYSIEPSWSCISDRVLLCLRLSSERMPEWIFLAMPFEHNKVKGMRGRTRSFQGRNNKARWMPLRLQNTASLFGKCVSLWSLFSLVQKTNGIIATGLWMADERRENNRWQTQSWVHRLSLLFTGSLSEVSVRLAGTCCEKNNPFRCLSVNVKDELF